MGIFEISLHVPTCELKLEVPNDALTLTKGRAEWCSVFAQAISHVQTDPAKLKRVGELAAQDILRTMAAHYHRRMQVEQKKTGPLKISIVLEQSEIPLPKPEIERRVGGIMGFLQDRHLRSDDKIEKKVKHN